MTSSVTITAQCSEDTEVIIKVNEEGEELESITLNNGQSSELYAFDDRVISVQEVEK